MILVEIGETQPHRPIDEAPAGSWMPD